MVNKETTVVVIAVVVVALLVSVFLFLVKPGGHYWRIQL